MRENFPKRMGRSWWCGTAPCFISLIVETTLFLHVQNYHCNHEAQTDGFCDLRFHDLTIRQMIGYRKVPGVLHHLCIGPTSRSLASHGVQRVERCLAYCHFSAPQNPSSGVCTSLGLLRHRGVQEQLGPGADTVLHQPRSVLRQLFRRSCYFTVQFLTRNGYPGQMLDKWVAPTSTQLEHLVGPQLCPLTLRIPWLGRGTEKLVQMHKCTQTSRLVSLCVSLDFFCLVFPCMVLMNMGGTFQ